VPGSSQTLGGVTYYQTGLDTFTNPQASGHAWSNGGDTTPVYTGDHGVQWVTYPDGWGANGVTPAYQPSTVLSVYDGVLDYSLHNDLGANLSPIISGSQYQTYGAFSFCEKLVPDATSPNGLRDFKQAILLWPQNDADGPAAESDFPEGNLSGSTMSAYAHNLADTQDTFTTPTLGTSQWHVYTQTWGPGFRNYYVDGTLIGTSTSQVWSRPERWQLQIQPDPRHTGGGSTGHVYINWAWIGQAGASHTSTAPAAPTAASLGEDQPRR
jgi:hypothetical protein